MMALRLLALIVTLGYRPVTSEVPPVGSVVMRIVNAAGAPIELFWVNVFQADEPLVKQTVKPIRNSSDSIINSYDTHRFVVKFTDDNVAKASEASFTKGPKSEVITITHSPEGGMIATQVTKYDEFLAKVKDHTAACVPKTGDEFDVCFSRALSEDVIKMEDKYTEVTRYRDSMSSRLRNYTCEDPTMVTSKPIQSLVMNVQNKNYNVDVLFDNPSAKIWIVHDFISDEECQILEDHGLPRLTRATVAGDDGRSIVSENRKAQQASYNMHQTHEHDPLRSLNERVLRITNERTGYKLRAGGQEDLTIIQYNKDDQYTPHCDGSCDGTLHKTGGRVATAVMYCRTATLGGGTTFSKADIFVKPTNGMATFFSYKGLDGRMEDGFTEHSGCPVLEGEKWITTQWMREGVTEADTWVNFDPSGVRSSEYETDTGAASEDVTSFDPALDAPEYENEEEYEEGEGEYETEEEFNARQEQEGEYLEEEVIERTDDIESSTVEKSGVTDEGQIAQDQVEVEKIKDGSVVIPDIVESAIKSPIAEEILSKSEDKEKAVENDWMGGVMNGYKSWASSIGKKWGATVDL